MTKPYHLTQEQDVKELCNEALKDFQYAEGVFEGRTFSYEELMFIINAALDKVLGEPVLYASPHYEQLLKHHNGQTLCGGKPSELHTLELYVPKVLT